MVHMTPLRSLVTRGFCSRNVNLTLHPNKSSCEIVNILNKNKKVLHFFFFYAIMIFVN